MATGHSGPEMDKPAAADWVLNFRVRKLHVDWVAGQSHILAAPKPELNTDLGLFDLGLLVLRSPRVHRL